MMPVPFRYITTPIYYVNDRPHLGHLYTSVAGDILARFYKLLGHRVKFVTGTDEHGAKVDQAARQQGLLPQEYVDVMVKAFQDLIQVAHVQTDDFIRTTEKRHHRAATALWNRLEQTGAIYLDHYAGWYAIRDEAYYDESELTDGPNGKIAPTGAPVEWVQEPCYFFRLSQFQQPLLDYYRDHPESIGPDSRYNEVVSFLNSGLRDLAVSRSKMTWGIGIPGSDHVMYVWVDALTNYLTALGYPDSNGPEFQDHWKESIHLMGKDILRFHAVYWPALLMAAGLMPPKRLFAHGWWMSEGQKMSKSLGNVIDPFALIDQYGVDRVRYFLFRHVRFGQDGDFSKELFQQRCNHELADGLGNLVHRVLSFIQNRLDRVMPVWSGGALADSEYSCLHRGADVIRGWASEQSSGWIHHMEEQNIYAYLESVYSGITKGNAYMAELAPWALLKLAHSGDMAAEQAMRHGLYALVSFLRDVAIALWPVIPATAQSIWTQLGLPGAIQDLTGDGVESRHGADGGSERSGNVPNIENGATAKLDTGVFSRLGADLLIDCIGQPTPLFSKDV
jgi:methionyl-tRNA synthetase